MDRNRALKAASASNIDVRDEFLDPRYTLNVQPLSNATPTGHLVLFRLGPVSIGEFPSFNVRWDQRGNTIDVDLDGDPAEARLFKSGLEGYQGHHPETVSADPRVFHIEIHNREFKVYESHLTCTIGLTLELKASLQPFDSSLSPQLMPKQK